MTDKTKKIIGNSLIIIVIYLAIFVMSACSEDAFNIIVGETSYREVTNRFGEPDFKKTEDGEERYFYGTDNSTGYIVLSFDSSGKVKTYLLADKTVMTACPNCLKFYKVKVSDPFETVYTCDACGYNYSKTDGIGAHKKQIMNFTTMSILSQRQ